MEFYEVIFSLSSYLFFLHCWIIMIGFEFCHPVVSLYWGDMLKIVLIDYCIKWFLDTNPSNIPGMNKLGDSIYLSSYVDGFCSLMFFKYFHLSLYFFSFSSDSPSLSFYGLYLEELYHRATFSALLIHTSTSGLFGGKTKLRHQENKANHNIPYFNQFQDIGGNLSPTLAPISQKKGGQDSKADTFTWHMRWQNNQAANCATIKRRQEL